MTLTRHRQRFLSLQEFRPEEVKATNASSEGTVARQNACRNRGPSQFT